MPSAPPGSTAIGSLDPLARALETALPELPPETRRMVGRYMDQQTFETDAIIAREGDRNRIFDVVVSGEAQLIRGGAEVARLIAGGHSGERGLLAGTPRAESVVAASPTTVARLPVVAFRRLVHDLPEVGLALMEVLATRLERHHPGPASAHVALPERSLPRQPELRVRLHGVLRVAPNGVPIRQLLPDRVKGRLVVAGLLDRRAVSLTTPLTSECALAPLTTGHWEGQRIYRESLALCALEAGSRLDRRLCLAMGPSVGFAQRVLISGSTSLSLEELAVQLEGSMRSLVQERAPLLEEWWTIEEAREHFEREGARSVAQLLNTWRDAAVPLVSYGSIYALRSGPLLPDTGDLSGFRVLADDDVLLLVYGSEAAQRPLPSIMAPAMTKAAPARIPTEVDRAYIASQAQRASQHAAAMTVVQERWLESLGVTSVGAFNDACVNGEVRQLIFVSEGYHEKRIGQIADEIAARLEQARIVCIAGPSSSGKTTFIRRLKTQLQVNGVRPVGIGLDDYYVDRDATPRDEAGAYDFEAFEALRIDLLQEHLARLLSGERVRTAHFDFQTGTSHPVGGPELRLGARDLLLLEGIHGLNPRLLSELDASRVFRVFVCPLAQLPFDALTRVHASDVRLIRRLVRDRHARAQGAGTTIQRWPSVREGERRHIFPFQHHADAVFDSSLIYELGVLRVFAERYLLEVGHDDPAYATAFRLLELLDRFVAIYPDHVPPTSILREFIGGSGFEY